VISANITPSIIIDEENIMANQMFKIKGVIKNDDATASYYNIKADIESRIYNENFALDKIIRSEEKVLFEKEAIAPTVNKTTDFVLNFSGKYETINSEAFTFFTSKTITVLPPSELIAIYHEFDKYVNESDKAQIKVYVENKRNYDLKVYADETIPLSFKVSAGETKNMINIGPKRKSLVYVFTIQAFDTEKKEELTTTLKFNETDREFTLTQLVSVNISAKTALNKEVITKVSVSGDETNNAADNETLKTNPDDKNTSIQQEQNNNIVSKPDKIPFWKRFFFWIDSLF
jgi:hypothetical protein